MLLAAAVMLDHTNTCAILATCAFFFALAALFKYFEWCDDRAEKKRQREKEKSGSSS